MNRTLAELTTLPLYGQVAIQDYGTSDLPQWKTGEERLVTSEHAIIVATRPDTDGDVTITVIEGEDTSSLGTLIFEGTLDLSSGALEVGNAVASTMTQVNVGQRGKWTIRILVDPEDMPARVTVLILNGRDEKPQET